MTEDEAKTKWCPYVNPQVLRTDRGSAISSGASTDRCIGSDCMAWRWSLDDTQTGEAFPCDSKKAAEYALARVASPCVIGGYCGLGGKP